MRVYRFIGLLLVIVLLATIFVTPVLSATYVSQAVAPQSLTTQGGSTSGALAALGTLDQTGTEDTPSAYMTSRFGKRSSLPLISQSTIEKQQLAKVMVEPTAGGASAEVDGIRLEEPMCMAMTVPVSSQAWRNGSQ